MTHIFNEIDLRLKGKVKYYNFIIIFHPQHVFRIVCFILCGFTLYICGFHRKRDIKKYMFVLSLLNNGVNIIMLKNLNKLKQWYKIMNRCQVNNLETLWLLSLLWVPWLPWPTELLWPVQPPLLQPQFPPSPSLSSSSSSSGWKWDKQLKTVEKYKCINV